jgi:hypothetical protein
MRERGFLMRRFVIVGLVGLAMTGCTIRQQLRLRD